MPFDIAATSSTTSYLLSSSDSEGKKKGQLLGCCGCCFLVVAISLLSAGSASLGRSEEDTRAETLEIFQQRMLDWTNAKRASFMALRLKLNGQEMRGQSFDVSPKFGESKPVIDTPPKLEDYRYVDYVSCPAVINGTCNVQLQSGDGRSTISTTITPRTQNGPTRTTELSQLCQWYDDDYTHPMAAMGMGRCNNDMHGNGKPNTYKYGPSKCVLDEYLDERGCPSDLIQTQSMVQYGWSWATVLNTQKRFTYESKNGAEYCWDYSDCQCSGCGYTFRSDASQGLTGYGYYSNGQWHAFPSGFVSMDENARVNQCRAVLSSIGVQCDSVNLRCFRAGGYPKKRCSAYCAEQDTRTGQYTPPATLVQMNTLYGPFGAAGTFPSYTNVPASCSYTRTTTEQVTNLRFVTNSTGGQVISKWVHAKDVERGEVPFPTPAPETVAIEVEVRANDGPQLAAANVLNSGCPVSDRPNQCFPKTPEEARSDGIVFVTIGSLVLLLALGCCAGAVKASSKG